MNPFSAILPLLAAATTALAAPPPIIDLWPEGVPGLKPDASPERIAGGRIVNIHKPTLLVFQPSDHNDHRGGKRSLSSTPSRASKSHQSCFTPSPASAERMITGILPRYRGGAILPGTI